jgi:hypothetical protein
MSNAIEEAKVNKAQQQFPLNTDVINEQTHLDEKTIEQRLASFTST